MLHCSDKQIKAQSEIKFAIASIFVESIEFNLYGNRLDWELCFNYKMIMTELNRKWIPTTLWTTLKHIFDAPNMLGNSSTVYYAPNWNKTHQNYTILNAPLKLKHQSTAFSVLASFTHSSNRLR